MASQAEAQWLKTRVAADGLEGIVSDELWPPLTYQETLSIK